MISMFAGVVSAETAEEAGARVGAEAKSVGEGIRAFFVALFGGAGNGEKSEWLSLAFFALLLGMFMYTALESFFSVENSLR